MYQKLIFLAFLSVFVMANNEVTIDNKKKVTKQEELYVQPIENSNEYILLPQ